MRFIKLTKGNEMSNFNYKEQEKFIADNKMVLVTQLNLSESYEWMTLEVYYKQDSKRFYWLSDSGCSCNFLWEGHVFSLEEFESGTKLNAVNAVRSFTDEGSYLYSASEIAQAISDVMMF